MIESAQKLVPGIALLIFLGCGGGSTSGGGGGGTTFTTSVKGSAMLNALTASEKAQLCADLAAFSSSAPVRMSECKLEGVISAAFLASFSATSTDAELRAACTSAVSSCVSQSADAGTDTTGNCDTSTMVPATCTATVAEYSACVSDVPQALGGFAPACSTLTRASLSSSDGGIGTSTGGGTATGGLPATSACNTLMAKCPDIATTALVARGR